MGKIIYVTGGARSGKSSFAERMINDHSNQHKKVYIATAFVYDKEMENRVQKHKIQRGETWETVETYRNISEKLKNILDSKVILLDCLTNLVTNFMLEDPNIDWNTVENSALEAIEKKIIDECQELEKFIRETEDTLVVVSNEVGMGIVPDNPLARHFRDIGGRANQFWGKISDEAYLVVSGLEIKIK